ncbi:MAG TPA: RagB/SusD family nutrient uptake outer membrane protein [Gemmatimonadaceae bacterium]|nr:RagB/SusD family nutrient uptake outer membrane protein [Gemmatimonadaceae bacterium]
MSRIPLVLMLAAAVAACSPDKIVGSGELPNGVNDPGATKTPQGALAAYRGALVDLGSAFGGYTLPVAANGSFIATTALLSDEMQAGDIGAPVGTSSAAGQVDARVLPEYVDPATEPPLPYRATYSALQVVRGQARQALGLLADYGPDGSTALRGHLYATLGYSEVMLAELFCSGIPLTTVDYDGNYTLRPGSSTDEVLDDAVALFDSALALSADSERFVNLARVGRGRALLDLGRFADAAQAVAEVPDGFSYAVSYFGADQYPSSNFENFAYVPPGLGWSTTTVDREGGNGLDYMTSDDPRTASEAIGTNLYGSTLYHPDKYAGDGSSPIVLGDWVEARLIEAEAALQAGDVTTWLAKLNHLRETAIVPALADTTDPGTADARVDLTFRERAFWLFLTGHRQGDLRRLVRQYGRQPGAVYPTGPYQGVTGAYGTDVTAPIPASERAFNPEFTGCKSRGA